MVFALEDDSERAFAQLAHDLEAVGDVVGVFEEVLALVVVVAVVVAPRPRTWAFVGLPLEFVEVVHSLVLEDLLLLVAAEHVRVVLQDVSGLHRENQFLRLRRLLDFLRRRRLLARQLRRSLVSHRVRSLVGVDSASGGASASGVVTVFATRILVHVFGTLLVAEVAHWVQTRLSDGDPVVAFLGGFLGSLLPGDWTVV